MVKCDRYGQLISRGRSAASWAVGAAATSITAKSAKRLHPCFAMTGNVTDVWPLSPEDWSTG
jgi:hypothetical protein